MAMKTFDYFQPTDIRFGCGRVSEVGEVVGQYGKRCLIVTVKDDVFVPLVARVKKSIEDAGVAVAHFDGVIPNPTTDCISAGAEMAVEHKADVVLELLRQCYRR